MNTIVDAFRHVAETAQDLYQQEVEPRLQAADDLYRQQVEPIVDAANETARQMTTDAITSGAQAIVEDPLGLAMGAATLPADAVRATTGAAATVVREIHEAGGIGNVARAVIEHNSAEIQRIQTELDARPEGFVSWLLGPEGPKVSGLTAQIPGAQQAIGDLIDVAMRNPLIAGVIGQTFGFEYMVDEDFYTTNESSLQSYAGFHDIYDKAGKLLGMDLDESVMEFEANGTEYRLELWKGAYGSGGAFGGEIALYTRGAGDRGALGNLLESRIPGYYSAVSGENQIQMTQTVYNTKTGEEYFTNDGKGADGTDKRHFWNLAIRTDPGVNHEELGQRGTLTLPESMPAQERAELANAIQQQLSAKEGIEDVSVSADGRSISYDWSGAGDRQ